MSRRAFIGQLVWEFRAGVARVLRRTARLLDDYPIEYMGPVHGENGVRRVPGIPARHGVPPRFQPRT